MYICIYIHTYTHKYIPVRVWDCHLLYHATQRRQKTLDNAQTSRQPCDSEPLNNSTARDSNTSQQCLSYRLSCAQERAESRGTRWPLGNFQFSCTPCLDYYMPAPRQNCRQSLLRWSTPWDSIRSPSQYHHWRRGVCSKCQGTSQHDSAQAGGGEHCCMTARRRAVDRRACGWLRLDIWHDLLSIVREGRRLDRVWRLPLSFAHVAACCNTRPIPACCLCVCVSRTRALSFLNRTNRRRMRTGIVGSGVCACVCVCACHSMCKGTPGGVPVHACTHAHTHTHTHTNKSSATPDECQ